MTLEEIYNYIKKNKDKKQLKNTKLSSLRKNWFQISLSKNHKPYMLSNVHFEIIKRNNNYNLEIHFEEDDTTRYKLDRQLNEILANTDFEWFEWWNRSSKNLNNKSLRLKQVIENKEDFLHIIENKHQIFNDILVRIVQQKNYYKDSSQMANIKNIILYGSPGVGKTHNTNKLISLIESKKPEKEIFEIIKNNEYHSSIDISELKERVQFITFHQSFGYEDFIEGFRPNEEGKIKLVNGIFKQICEKAQKNLVDSKIEVNSSKIDLDELMVKFTNYIQDSLDEGKDFFLTSKITIESINNTGSFLLGGSIKSNTQRLTVDILKRDYELFKEGLISSYEDIKPTYDSQRTFHGNARYYYFLYKKLYEFEQTLNIIDIERVKVEQKNYYLVIDEINRGNISKIFGELITLIEEDKRDILELTLPYSKKPFKIPLNLYIIGTMNSTDKSIALIDIALRRRFTFLKMKPKAELIGYQPAKEIFEKLNKQIEEDLGEDYQLGHSYFMKIQDEHDLAFVLEYKIIPLLEEYYYGDDRLKDVIKTCQN